MRIHALFEYWLCREFCTAYSFGEAVATLYPTNLYLDRTQEAITSNTGKQVTASFLSSIYSCKGAGQWVENLSIFNAATCIF